MERFPQPSGQAYILIVDRDNFIGGELAKLLQEKAATILVTKEKAVGDTGLVVPYGFPNPTIPEGDYERIALVWDKDASSLVLPLSQKASEMKIPFFILFTHEQQKEVVGNENNAVLVELGDLFGAPVAQPLDSFLRSAKSKKRILLSGMGLHLWRPVFFNDAVRGVSALLLGTSGVKSIFIGPPHDITALGLAHGLQKIDPDIVIDFSPQEKQEKGDHIVGQSILPHYDALKALRSFYQVLASYEREGKKKEAAVILTRTARPKRKKSSKLMYFLYVVLLLAILPISVLVGGEGLGALFLSAGIHDVQQGELLKAKQEVAAAEACFYTAEQSTAAIADLFPLIRSVSYFTWVEKKALLGQRVSQMAKEAVDAGERLSGVLLGKTLTPKEDSVDAVGDLKHLDTLFSSLNESDIPDEYKAFFGNAKKVTALGSGVIEELPQILGVLGEKKYLLLFLNNMELRPGGGFIGSYGLLTLHNGAVKDFTIHDVYDADGQLRGHVEPPFAVRRYIPIVHLFLRDSNFDPDFSKDAQIAASFLSQETGDKVDGVIGVDLNAFQGVLSAVGSIYVPSYGQSVTDKNFFSLLESHAEKNFFPGSTQKQDFLRAVASALLVRLQQRRDVNGQQLVASAVSSLAQKHIVISFADPLLQAPFSYANLSGELSDFRASASATFNDFFGIVEANLGINKANAYVERKLDQQISIGENGDLQEVASVTLSNSSDGTWPGGSYKNFLRFILPKNARITDVAIDGVEQDMTPAVTDPKIYEGKSFVAPKGLEITEEQVGEKIMHGFLVTIPLKKTVEIRISYVIPAALSSSALSQSYSMLFWKQVGVAPYSYTFSVRIPNTFQFLKTTSLGVGQSFVTSGLFDSDTTFLLPFAKK